MVLSGSLIRRDQHLKGQNKMKRLLFTAVFLLLGVLAIPNRAAAQSYQTTCPQGSSVNSWGSARNGSTGAILQNYCTDANGNAVLNFPFGGAQNCVTTGGVAFENGTTNTLTCDPNFKYSPTSTWWVISASGADNTTIEGNMSSAGHPLLQLNSSTTGTGAAVTLDAFNGIAEFGPGGANFATVVAAQSVAAGFPVASSGIYRVSKAGTFVWRNNANSADLPLGINASNQLTYNNTPILPMGGLSSLATSGSTNVLLAVAANTTALTSWYIPWNISTASNFVYSVGSVADNTANNYDLGIYGPGCLGGATNVPLIFHTGALPGTTLFPSIGVKNLALSGAPVAINIVPGWYCFAVTSDGNAVAPAARVGGDTGGHMEQFANQAAPAGGTGTTVGGVLNPTITAPATSFQIAGQVFIQTY